jgi:hypothetical protein
MILWVIAVNCYHAAQGKPEQFTPKEGAFEVADYIF